MHAQRRTRARRLGRASPEARKRAGSDNVNYIRLSGRPSPPARPPTSLCGASPCPSGLPALRFGRCVAWRGCSAARRPLWGIPPKLKNKTAAPLPPTHTPPSASGFEQAVASGAPDASLTPEWFPGQFHDPASLYLPDWRAMPEPRIGPWSTWKTPGASSGKPGQTTNRQLPPGFEQSLEDR